MSDRNLTDGLVHQDSSGADRLISNHWYVLGVLTFVYAINIADRIAISTLIEPIKGEFGLSDASVGFLTSAALAIFYVAAGIPIATLADRWNRRSMVLIALVSWSFMTALCGLAQNYWQMLLARIGVGVGEAGGTPPSTSIISDYFPARDRAMALTIFVLGVPVGSWLGTSVAGSIAEAFGWRAPLLALSIPGFIAVLLVWTVVKEPRRGRLDATTVDRSPASLGQTLAFMRTRKSIVHLVAGCTVHAYWGGGLLWWTSAFLMRSHDLSIGQAGTTLGRMHLIGGTVSILLTSWLMARPSAIDPRHISRLIALSTVAATIPAVIAYSVGAPHLTVLMLWIFVTLSQLYFGPTVGLLQNLVTPGMRAQALAVCLFTLNVANLIIAPQVIGLLSDWLVPYAGNESLRWALVISAPLGLWSAYHYWRAERSVRQDYASVGIVTQDAR